MNADLRYQLEYEIARCGFQCEVHMMAAAHCREIDPEGTMKADLSDWFERKAQRLSERAFELAMSLAREA